MVMYTKTILLKDTNLLQDDRTRDFYTNFLQKLTESNLAEQIQVVRASDVGVYNQGVVIKIMPDNIIYGNVQDTDIQRIINTTIKEGKAIQELLLKREGKQLRIVLRNCGNIDPENIRDYIGVDGYLA